MKQGGLGEKMLNAMNIDDVIRLFGNVEGVDVQRIPDYATRLKANNVTGPVLLHCDLAELKPVVNMSFGDWQLFRGLVEELRNRKARGGAPAPSPADVTTFSLAGVELERRSPVGMKSILTTSGDVDATIPSLRSLHPMTAAIPLTIVTGNKTTKASDKTVKIGDGGEYTLPTVQLVPALRRRGVIESPMVVQGEKTPGLLTPGLLTPGMSIDEGEDGDRYKSRMNRQNSFVTEVMMESEVSYCNLSFSLYLFN